MLHNTKGKYDIIIHIFQSCIKCQPQNRFKSSPGVVILKLPQWIGFFSTASTIPFLWDCCGCSFSQIKHIFFVLIKILNMTIERYSKTTAFFSSKYLLALWSKHYCFLNFQVSPETTLTVMSHKTPQVQEKVGTVVAVSNTAAQVTRVVTAGTPTGRRAMFVLNESPTHTINRVSQQNQTATIHSEL